MAERLTLVWAFRQANRHHVRDTFEWLFYTMLGGLLPVWGGAILYRFFVGGATLLHFASHGEFTLYSAALLGPAIYIVVKEREEVSFPSRGSFVLSSIIFLLVAALIFAGITVFQGIKVISSATG